MIKINTKKNLIIISLSLLLLVGAVLIVLELTHVTDFYRKTPKTTAIVTPQDQKNTVDLNPATEVDQDEVEANKQKLGTSSPAPVSTPSDPSQTVKKSVEPTITYAGLYGANVEASGYIGNLYEKDGTCTYTFSDSTGTKITRQTRSVINNSSIDCPQVSISKSEFVAGQKYSLTLSYDGSTASGTSQKKEVSL